MLLEKIKKDWKKWAVCIFVAILICIPVWVMNYQKKTNRYEHYNYFGGELIIDKETGTSMLIRK